tara:strand:+ start:177 stop:818 length:642 start_codon:yes stop_codon:yes gene_type:complete
VERALWQSGQEVVVGVDEVGKGAWAGPISVGAAIIPKDRRIYKIRDSKMLTEQEREAIFDRIASWCIAWEVGHASEVECDRFGMAEAQRRAARRALNGIGLKPDMVLFDGRWDFTGAVRSKGIVRGDATSLSISTASILAKVTRDRFMREEAKHYPYWDFASNKGYPSPRHKAALAYFGPSGIHRKSWSFMDRFPYSRMKHLGPPKSQQRLFT